MGLGGPHRLARQLAGDHHWWDDLASSRSRRRIEQVSSELSQRLRTYATDRLESAFGEDRTPLS